MNRRPLKSRSNNVRGPFIQNFTARRSSEASPVHSILSKALASKGLDKKLDKYIFVSHWHEIVGEELAQKTKPECLRNKALVIRVQTSAWAQELSFHKKAILENLKRFLPEGESIDDVQFYVAGNTQL